MITIHRSHTISPIVTLSIITMRNDMQAIMNITKISFMHNRNQKFSLVAGKFL